MKLKLVRVKNNLATHSGIFGSYFSKDHKGRVIDDSDPNGPLGNPGAILLYSPDEEYFVFDYWGFPDDCWEALECRSHSERQSYVILHKRHCEEVKGIRAKLACLVKWLNPTTRRIMKMSESELSRRRVEFLKKLVKRDQLFAEQMTQFGLEM